MEKELLEIKERIETLDTYMKNKVGYLEGKLKETETKTAEADGSARYIFSLVHPLVIELNSLLEYLIDKKVIEPKEFEEVIKSNNEKWIEEMNKKTGAKSQIVTP